MGLDLPRDEFRPAKLELLFSRFSENWHVPLSVVYILESFEVKPNTDEFSFQISEFTKHKTYLAQTCGIGYFHVFNAVKPIVFELPP